MDLIDTHQHLIYRQSLGYGWTAGVPALASGDFTLADYAGLTAGRGVSGTIFMECGVDDGDYQAEGRLIGGLVGQQGLLGQIASCRPEEDAGFDPWLEEGAGLNVVGYRRILHVVPDEMSQTTGFRANLRKIGAMGLPFDMCFLGRQLALAADLAKACSDQVLVLDHCGTPDIAGGDFASWAKGITALARHENVMAKLSGITAYCAPGTAGLAQVQPWADHVLQSFGAGRIVWGSDWPVVNLGVGLPDWIGITRTLIAGLSASEQQAIASGNARRIYLKGR
jgi:predicted TIM-barrel fold metal-dependent hydrolase